MTLKPASPNSAHSAHFDPLAAIFLAIVSATAVWFVQHNGWTTWYGDSEAHLNIARRILDSRTPGYDQIGTVWLPLPHLLMLPFVRVLEWWHNGLAGAVTAAAAFWAGGLLLFHGVRRVYGRPEAWAAMLAWALNPNLLFQQSIPMTEPLSMACVLGLFWALARLRDSEALSDAALAGLFALAGTLSRYESWELLPLAAICVFALGGARRFQCALLFCLIGALGPLYWLGHNQFFYSNALEFYNGYYSGRMIEQRFVNAGGFRYPGYHDWSLSFLYYRTAAATILGEPLYYLGVLGLIAALFSRLWWAVLILFTFAAFYIASLHDGGTPLYVPTLWPHSYYNVRYGLNALPFACLGLASLVALTPSAHPRLGDVGRKWLAVFALIAVVSFPWLRARSLDAVATWKESMVNSAERMAWTADAAQYLRANYHFGEGILMPFGNLTGILREASIPIRETLHEGNGLAFVAAAQRPEIAMLEDWALDYSNGKVSTAMARLTSGDIQAECVHRYALKDGRSILIWKVTHNHGNSLLESTRSAERLPADVVPASAAGAAAGPVRHRHLPPVRGRRR
jgi:hypothetical protein